NPDGVKKCRSETHILLVVFILINATAGYFLASPGSPLYRATHQKSVYLSKSEFALKKAVRLNPIRSDIYKDLIISLMARGKSAEASKVAKITKQLPPPDIRQRLYIIY
ncbi:MAG: hypothetical protein LWY06_12340, partial [Firmicutes bacterium]|nr:hypothetical protein [Bacillota bacterium]